MCGRSPGEDELSCGYNDPVCWRCQSQSYDRWYQHVQRLWKLLFCCKYPSDALPYGHLLVFRFLLHSTRCSLHIQACRRLQLVHRQVLGPSNDLGTIWPKPGHFGPNFRDTSAQAWTLRPKMKGQFGPCLDTSAQIYNPGKVKRNNICLSKKNDIHILFYTNQMPQDKIGTQIK